MWEIMLMARPILDFQMGCEKECSYAIIMPKEVLYFDLRLVAGVFFQDAVEVAALRKEFHGQVGPLYQIRSEPHLLRVFGKLYVPSR
jgi:hypothetical protein